ncbi:MAG: metal-sulfur cluster assembly factor [Candidatus Paceibacterota bacterium]
MTNEKQIEFSELRLKVIQGLREIIDPELGVNIVDLGLIYQAYMNQNVFHLHYTITTPGCPVRRYIHRSIEKALKSVEGIDVFEVHMVLKPDWSVEMIIEDVDFFSVPPPIIHNAEDE